MLPLLPWKHDLLNLKFGKNDNLASIIEIMYLKTDFFKTDSCLLTLTTFTSHMQVCFKIDLIFIESKSLFGDHHEMADIWAKI